MELIFLFKTTHSVISAEQTLLEQDIPVKVMPVPGAIRAGCGLCLRIAPDHGDRARAELEKESIPVEALYQMEAGRFKPFDGNSAINPGHTEKPNFKYGAGEMGRKTAPEY